MSLRVIISDILTAVISRKHVIVFWWAVIITLTTILPRTHGDRHKPKPDEIERVIDDYNSVIWKCSQSECPTGTGLTVKCGTSVPFSTSIHCEDCQLGKTYSDTHGFETCKKCHSCTATQRRIGKCALDEDTTKCVCKAGYYKADSSAECSLCSWCCGDNRDHYEAKCAHMPPKQQCRKQIRNCVPPTATLATDIEHTKLSSAQITVIAVGSIIAVILLIFFFALWYSSALREKVRRIFHREVSESPNNVPGEDMQSFENRDIQSSVNNTTVDLYGGNVDSPPCSLNGNINSSRTSSVAELNQGIASTGNPRPKLQSQISHQPAPSKAVLPFYKRFHSHPGAHKENAEQKLHKGRKALMPPSFLTQIFNRKDQQLYLQLENDEPASKVPERGLSETAELHKANGVHTVGTSLQQAGQDRDLQQGSWNSAFHVGEDHCPGKDQQTSTSDLAVVTHKQEQLDSSKEKLAAIRKKVLDTRASNIPYSWLREISMLLNVNRGTLGGDYRDLGEKMGLKPREVRALERREDPTDTLLQKLGARKDGTVGKFVEYLQQMERFDVIEVIEKWTPDQSQSHAMGSTFV